MPRRLTWAEVRQERLRRHWLTSPAAPEQLAQVVGQVCGIHAQVAVSAELSLGLRVAGLTARGVQAALWQDRTLVKTYGIRGTLHLLPRHEVGLWLAALRSVPPLPRPASNPGPISAEQRAEIVAAMHQALDGRQLTRDELGQALADLLGAWVNAETFPAFGGLWRPWQVALSTAAHQGVVCFGPPQGQRVTYLRLDQWLARPAPPAAAPQQDGRDDRAQAQPAPPAADQDARGQADSRRAQPAPPARSQGGRGPGDSGRAERAPRSSARAEDGPHNRAQAELDGGGPGRSRRAQARPALDQLNELDPLDPLDGQAALREVVRRYVAAYGPTTHVEVARWLATTPTAARDLLGTLDLERVDVEGWPAFVLPPAAPSAQPASRADATCAEPPRVHLLPQFDCYVVGSHPRRQLIPASAPPALQQGTAATFSVLLVDGVVAGLWQRQRHGSRLELIVDPFVDLSRPQRQALHEQARRVAEILGLEPKLSLGHVEPRAHL